MRRLGRTVGVSALVLVAAVWLAIAGPVAGHALLSASDPASGAVLATTPASLSLTFTEAPDPALSSIRLLDSAGRALPTGPIEVAPGDGSTLRVTVSPLADGVYTVAWRTVSSVDGHDVAGSFAFTVGTAPAVAAGPVAASYPPTASAGVASVSPGVVAGRWLLYVGLGLLLGTAIVGAARVGRPARGTIRTLRVALVLSIGGTVLLVAAQAADAGVSLAQVPGTSLGRAIALRLAPLVVAAIALATGGGESRRRPLLGGVAVAATIAMLADAVSSHASSGPWPDVNVVVQWLHFVAAGAWVGALPALLFETRGAPSAATASRARTFATWAGLGLLVVGSTGIARAAVELGRLDELWTSSFGQLVIVKSTALVSLAAIGSLNHFRNVPAAGRDLRGLRRAASLEVAIGAAALLIAAELVNVPPPAEVLAAARASSAAAAAGQAAGLAASGSDYGTSVRLRLRVSPGMPGQNTFVATVVDYDTGAPVTAARIVLQLGPSDRPDVAPSQLILLPAAEGTFRASGTNLSISGSWSVEATVDESSTSVDVPLTLTVPAAPQQVDILRTPGAPTIYSIHLPAGRTVQVYLDPGSTGSNDLHATWFDAGGKEQAVSNAAMRVVSGSATVGALAVRILDPGHEVAQVTVGSGPVTFSFDAVASDGEPLHAQLQVTPAP